MKPAACYAFHFVVLLYLCASTLDGGETEQSTGLEFFETRIRPALAEHCYECHSRDSQEVKGNLLVDSAAGLLQGGDSGPALVAEKPDESLLLEALRFEGLEMPPAGKLPESVIRDFELWIEMGAPHPRDGAAANSPGRLIDIEAGRKFWAFQPVQSPRIPRVKDDEWPIFEIDAFVLAALEHRGLTPSSDAERATLVRRLYYDLIGLPPTPDDIIELVSDPSPNAIERLVDKLLDSPQFGVHWGRHWLDVARYADSNGGDFNATFHNAWRYRDYVVDALNDDKPFDQFVREQVAGDLLPHDNDELRTEQVIATGFLMVGTKMLSERDKEKLRMDVVDEQINTIGKAFMGLTLGCARCHDHKFDPVPMRDYYALAGIFRSTSTLEGESQQYVSTWPRRPLPASARQAAAVKKHESERQDVESEFEAAKKALAIAATRLERREQARELKQARTAVQALQAQVDNLQKRLEEITQNAPAPLPKAIAVADHKEIADCEIRVRGEMRNLGPIIQRGFLQVASRGETPAIPNEQSGRRQLADWIAGPDHPLTSRVIVNRIWYHLFGEGLVRSVDNFGALGERPTHPELLDYLASEFMRANWSIKRIVRRIALSRTYRMSSAHDEQAWQVDPENRWLWRAHRRRLPAESIRDSMLAVSDQLELRLGGSPVAGFGTLVTNNSADAKKFASQETFTRSLYLPIIRNELPPILALFDFADPDLVTGKRPSTNVPAQSLLLMNSPFVMNCSDRAAQSLLANERGDDRELAVELYQLVFARRPTTAEVDQAVAFLLGDSSDKAKQLARLVHVLLASTEFRTLN